MIQKSAFGKACAHNLDLQKVWDAGAAKPILESFLYMY